jgi:hypothetical protein
MRPSRGRGGPVAFSRGGAGTVKCSIDPELEAKVRDAVGPYLHPPRDAIVLCVDEKSEIQALNRTQPILPARPGLPEKATHDCKRSRTTTLFAALEVATGTVTECCYDRHGKAEILESLKLSQRPTRDARERHLVLDDYNTKTTTSTSGPLNTPGPPGASRRFRRQAVAVLVRPGACGNRRSVLRSLVRLVGCA